MPFISVIIALYNKEDYIKSTIDSVISQSFQDYELIIINDGSTDNSLHVAKHASKDIEQVLIHDQENRGLSVSRNTGIRMANGKVIALLDADDTWDKGFLFEIRKLYNEFEQASLYGTDFFQNYGNGILLEPKKNLAKSFKNKSFIVEDFFEANLFHLIVSQSNFAFKKEVFDSAQYNENIDFGEDVQFYIKSNLKFKFAYSYKPLATVNFDISNQMTNTSITGKRLPNFNAFESDASKNPSLKKFLDINRYSFMIKSRMYKDKEAYNQIAKHIDYGNLNLKQKLLLKSPLPILRLLKFIKKTFLKYNIRLTSFNG